MTQIHHDRHTDADATRGGATFTPGPWTFRKAPDPYGDSGDEHEIHWSSDGECVAEVVHGETDARLIAAAPDLFAALQDVMEMYEGSENWSERRFSVALEKARAALSLATRREPSPGATAKATLIISRTCGRPCPIPPSSLTGLGRERRDHE